MKQLKSRPYHPQHLSQEEELEYRRQLLRKARAGDPKAQLELKDSYGVKLYSEAERAAVATHMTHAPVNPRKRARKPAAASRGRTVASRKHRRISKRKR